MSRCFIASTVLRSSFFLLAQMRQTCAYDWENGICSDNSVTRPTVQCILPPTCWTYASWMFAKKTFVQFETWKNKLFLPEFFLLPTKNAWHFVIEKLLNIVIHNCRWNTTKIPIKAIWMKTFVYILLSSQRIQHVLCTNTHIIFATELCGCCCCRCCCLSFASLPSDEHETRTTHRMMCEHAYTLATSHTRDSDATCWMLAAASVRHTCLPYICDAAVEHIHATVDVFDKRVVLDAFPMYKEFANLLSLSRFCV